MASLGTGDLPVLIFAPFGKDSSLIERVLHQSAVTTRILPTVEELEVVITEEAGAADGDGTLLKATIPVSAADLKSKDMGPALTSRDFPSAFSAD